MEFFFTKGLITGTQEYSSCSRLIYIQHNAKCNSCQIVNVLLSQGMQTREFSTEPRHCKI